MLLGVTALLVLLFGRFEDPRTDDRHAPPLWQPLLAAVLVCSGLAVMADAGMVGPDGLHWIWPVLPLVGMLAGGVVGLRRSTT